MTNPSLIWSFGLQGHDSSIESSVSSGVCGAENKEEKAVEGTMHSNWALNFQFDPQAWTTLSSLILNSQQNITPSYTIWILDFV